MKKQNDFLFDVQGPVGKRRTKIATGISSVIILAIVCAAIIQLGKHGQLSTSVWNVVLSPTVLKYLLNGLLISLGAGFVAGILALPVSILVAVARLSSIKTLRVICTWYVEITRSLPLLLIIFFFQLYLPQLGFHMPVFWQLVLPLAIYHISVISEIFRAGIESVPAGQREAALSLGVSSPRLYFSILLPQALKVILPTLINQFIRLFKDTSLGFIVSLPELLTRGRIMGEYTSQLFAIYVVVGVIYLIIDLILAWSARRLEKSMTKSPKSNKETKSESLDDASGLGLSV